MKHFIFITLFLPNLLFAQDAKHALGGTFYYKSIYYGGVDMHEESIIPVPMTNAMFYLVRYKGEDLTPEPIQSFTTDEKGEFKIYVSPGEYGFILATELDSLKPGQYMPASTEQGDLELTTYSTWETGWQFPVRVSTSAVENITLTNYVRSYCYICP